MAFYSQMQGGLSSMNWGQLMAASATPNNLSHTILPHTGRRVLVCPHGHNTLPSGASHTYGPGAYPTTVLLFLRPIVPTAGLVFMDMPLMATGCFHIDYHP